MNAPISDSVPASPPPSKQRKPFFSIILGLLVFGAIFVAYRYWHRPVYPLAATPSGLHTDLRYPDMLLTTHNLADLPKDIASAPILSGLVDEQLVFHYEEDEARLSIEGILRRLAYEHNLELQDRFLAALLNAPAEIALWRSGKGRPEHFVARMERSTLAKLTETFARIALDDRQLKQIGTFSLSGDEVAFYTLAYGNGRALGFAGLGEHWVFLSDMRIALDEEGELTESAALILDDLLHGQRPWKGYLPTPDSAKHSFAIARQPLTMEYGRFIAGFAAVRFDYQNSSWQPALRLAPIKTRKSYETAPIWRTLPIDAALCSALPVDWAEAQKPLEQLLGEGGDVSKTLPADIAQTLAALDPVAAICWYPDSRLSAPLFVARATRELPPQTGELLLQLAQNAWQGFGEKASSGNDGAEEMLVANIASRHGIRPSQEGKRGFNVTLAHKDKLIFFSPHQPQVEAALAVAAKRMSALGDEAGLRGEAWLTFDPALLAKLVRAEVQEVLPADEESFFREVARTRLWPRLEAWGKQQSAMVLQPGKMDSDGFIALDVKPLKGRTP